MKRCSSTEVPFERMGDAAGTLVEAEGGNQGSHPPTPLTSAARTIGKNKGGFPYAWLAILPLLGWWLYGLFDLDEGFYAAVVAEMNRRGEWITPYFNGHPWFEKPVLLYWVAKPCLALFGGEFGIRLPSILASLATYAIIAWFGKRRL